MSASLRELLSTNASDIVGRIVLRESDRTTLRAEFRTILQKAQYCCRMGFLDALSIFLNVIRQAFEMDPGLAPMLTLDHGLLEQLIDLLIVCLELPLGLPEQPETPSSSVLEVLELCSVVAATNLKETLAPKLLPLLLKIMRCPFYRLARLAASAWINLLRGSKSNRNRCGSYLSILADLLEQSTDIYLQIAVLEILFRLYTHDSTMLRQGGVSSSIQELVAALPNDSTLLVAIESALVDHINKRRRDNHSIETVDVSGLDIGDDITLSSATRIHFNRQCLVFLVLGGHTTVDTTVTIPYADVRSLRVSKDNTLRVALHRITEELYQLVPRLRQLYPPPQGPDDNDNDNHIAGTAVPTLHIFLTTASMGQLKQSSVYAWIKNARASSSPQTRRAAPAVVSSTTTTTAVAEEPYFSPTVGGKRSRSAAGRSSDRHGSRAGESEEVDEEDRFTIRPRPTTTTTSSRSESVTTTGTSASRLSNSVPQLVSQQVALTRESFDNLRSDMVMEIERLVEEYRKQSAEDRERFQEVAKTSKATLALAHEELNSFATSQVAKLNEDLFAAQELGEGLQRELQEIETQVKQCVSRASETEHEKLTHIKATVDSDIDTLEKVMLIVTASSNPLHFLAVSNQ